MAHNTHRLYPLIAVALLAAGTTWLDRITRVDTPNSLGKLSPSPDALVDNARVLHFDRGGNLHQVLESASMRHFPSDGSALLSQPRLRLLDGPSEMRIAADSGQVSGGGTEIMLSGQVRAERRSGPNELPLHFESASLRVLPDSQQASTTDPVVLRQGRSEVHGQSMRADSLFGTLQLQGSVRATLQGNKTR